MSSKKYCLKTFQSGFEPRIRIGSMNILHIYYYNAHCLNVTLRDYSN